MSLAQHSTRPRAHMRPRFVSQQVSDGPQHFLPQQISPRAQQVACSTGCSSSASWMQNSVPAFLQRWHLVWQKSTSTGAAKSARHAAAPHGSGLSFRLLFRFFFGLLAASASGPPLKTRPMVVAMTPRRTARRGVPRIKDLFRKSNTATLRSVDRGNGERAARRLPSWHGRLFFLNQVLAYFGPVTCLLCTAIPSRAGLRFGIRRIPHRFPSPFTANRKPAQPGWGQAAMTGRATARKGPGGTL